MKSSSLSSKKIQRKLPKWMQDQPKVDGSRKKKQISSKEFVKKKKHQDENCIKRTVYCMSPDEFYMYACNIYKQSQMDETVAAEQKNADKAEQLRPITDIGSLEKTKDNEDCDNIEKGVEANVSDSTISPRAVTLCKDTASVTTHGKETFTIMTSDKQIENPKIPETLVSDENPLLETIPINTLAFEYASKRSALRETSSILDELI